MFTITILLVALAMAFAVGSASVRWPLWPSPFLLALLELLRLLPLG